MPTTIALLKPKIPAENPQPWDGHRKIHIYVDMSYDKYITECSQGENHRALLLKYYTIFHGNIESVTCVCCLDCYLIRHGKPPVSYRYSNRKWKSIHTPEHTNP